MCRLPGLTQRCIKEEKINWGAASQFQVILVEFLVRSRECKDGSGWRAEAAGKGSEKGQNLWSKLALQASRMKVVC